MSREWQISIFAAVACHLAILFGIRLDKPAQLIPKAEIQVELIAAPAPQAVAKPAPLVDIPKLQPPTPPVLAKIPDLLPSPTPMLRHQVEPNEIAQPPSVTRPPKIIAEDNSPPKPTPVTETPKAPPIVRAEPIYLKNPEPDYPPMAKRRHEQGLVLLAVKVSAGGHALKIELKQSSGFPLLDQAAIKAVAGWEFVPARAGPLAVDSEIEVPVRFKIAD